VFPRHIIILHHLLQAIIILPPTIMGNTVGLGMGIMVVAVPGNIMADPGMGTMATTIGNITGDPVGNIMVETMAMRIMVGKTMVVDIGDSWVYH